MTHIRMTVLALASLILVTLSAGIASASIGVGTTTPEIAIDQDVRPGGIYRLPPIPVINTGSEKSDFKVFVDSASEQSVHFADPGWITVSPTTISLEAGQSGIVSATMKVPLNARQGEYQALVIAQPIVPGATADMPSIQVGTKVTFRMVQSNLLVALYWRVRSLFEIWTPWSYIAPVVLLALLLAWFLARRYRVSLVVSRRS